MKISPQVLAWILVRASVESDAIVSLASDRIPQRHVRNASRMQSANATVALRGSGADSSNASAEEFSQEIEQLRETRFFTRPGSKKGPVKTVWIVGLGRSGTTLLQNLIVSAAAGQGYSVFAAFEPCHSQDVFRREQVGFRQTVALQCMKRALQCDFSSIEQKHKKKTRQQLARRSLHVPPSLASDACAMSTVRVFKTIYPMPTSFERIDELMRIPNVRIIQISRDPRSIYSSVFNNLDFKAVADKYTPKKICQTEMDFEPEWKNASLDKQLLPLRFESLVTRHNWEIRRMLSFLSWKESELLGHFVRTHLGADRCYLQNQRTGYKYGTCRTMEDTMDVITKWKRNLNLRQKTMFTYGVCERAVDTFGYRAAWKLYG